MKINPYLNFNGTCEEAFALYRSVFGGEFAMFRRMKDAPAEAEMSNVSDAFGERVLHVSLPMKGGDVLMGSDTLEEDKTSQKDKSWNTTYLSVHPDSKEEAERIFAELSEGGKVEMPLEKQFWGDDFGMLVDRYGVHWMVNYSEDE